jgi:hypothetical protein
MWNARQSPRFPTLHQKILVIRGTFLGVKNNLKTLVAMARDTTPSVIHHALASLEDLQLARSIQVYLDLSSPSSQYNLNLYLLLESPA